jgi:DnaD/phage-associated family protein
MAIIRVLKNKNNPYVMVNKTCLQDNELSWKAKGLHTYIMSLPDDWKIYIDDLKNRSKDGREATSNILRELIEKGYIKRITRRDADTNRLLGGYDYEVYEVPLDNPQKLKPRKSENPITGKLDSREVRESENPTLLSNNYKLNNNLELNNELILTNKEIVGYSDKLLGEIGPNNKIKLLEYVEDGFEKEVIIKAIDIAVENGNRNFKYVKGILNNWLSNNIKTMLEVEDHQRKFEKRNKGESNGKYQEYAKHLDREDKTTISSEEATRAAAELGIDL